MPIKSNPTELLLGMIICKEIGIPSVDMASLKQCMNSVLQKITVFYI